KIGRNVERDRANLAALAKLGWDVRVIWECEVKAATESLIGELLSRDNIAAERTRCRPIGADNRPASAA
ncbi:MAG TPA: hypothetical protein VFX03_13890, partial [Thermomicrobiales bacterium]|nr:hypothetical protein [Thermomicrobiales bacterium]